MKVIRTQSGSLNPWAQCMGDDPDPEAETNCSSVWGCNSMTLADIKQHVKDNPTHQVLVVHETRSVYGANG